MATQDTPPLTDKELDILEQLWDSDPDWAKDSLIVLRELRRLREAARKLLRINKPAYDFCKDYAEEFIPGQPSMEAIRTEDFFATYDRLVEAVGEEK